MTSRFLDERHEHSLQDVGLHVKSGIDCDGFYMSRLDEMRFEETNTQRIT